MAQLSQIISKIVIQRLLTKQLPVECTLSGSSLVASAVAGCGEVFILWKPQYSLVQSQISLSVRLKNFLLHRQWRRSEWAKCVKSRMTTCLFQAFFSMITSWTASIWGIPLWRGQLWWSNIVTLRGENSGKNTTLIKHYPDRRYKTSAALKLIGTAEKATARGYRTLEIVSFCRLHGSVGLFFVPTAP